MAEERDPAHDRDPADGAALVASSARVLRRSSRDRSKYRKRRQAVRTDPHSLTPPPDLHLGNRDVTFAAQVVTVDTSWWDRHLTAYALPGGPLTARATYPTVAISRPATATGSRMRAIGLQPVRAAPTTLTRSDVWAHAPVTTDQDAFRLLWHALAWGSGSRRRLCVKRMQSVAADPARAAAILRRSAELASTDPEAAYAHLHPRGSGALPFLGPAFGTKYLYFAGAGRPDHPSLILDQRVARSLRQAGWADLRDTAWAPSTYAQYCVLAHRWATTETNAGPTAPAAASRADAAADQVEYWLFSRR